MWIKNRGGLLELCEQIDRSPVVGIDTEFAAERRYYPRFDLLQVAIADVAAAIDVHMDLDLSPLIDRLFAPDRTLLFHAGSQDLGILFRLSKRLPGRIFDTQTAAAMVGYGAQISYAALVKQITGIALAKTESLTDWSRRPLKPEQIAYALDDVRYLLPLYTHLQEKLEACGRTAWFEEESRRQLNPQRFGPPDVKDRWRRMSGWTGLTPRQIGVLDEVVSWREAYAMSKDLPPRAILPDEVMVHLTRRPPATLQDLREIRQIFERTIHTCGNEILAAVRRGLERPEAEVQALAAAWATEETPPGLVELLSAILRARCEQASIASNLLASQGDLEQLIQDVRAGRPSEVDLVKGWRLELAGRDLLRVLHGQAAVRVDPASGQVLYLPDEALEA